MTKRIGITGLSGIMGQTLQQNFQNNEWVSFVGEILNSLEIETWLEKAGRIDALVHLAALVPTHLVEADPAQALRVNVEGTVRLLEAVQKKCSNPLWVFVASTCHVYASSPLPLDEDSPLSPISLYGLTKLHAEQWATAYQKKYPEKLKLCIGRIFSTHSPLHPKTYLIPSLIQKLKEASKNSKFELRGLNGTRDFMTARQAVEAIHFLLEKKAEGVFNIASGHPIRLLDLVKKTQKHLGREDVQIIALDQDTSHLIANVDKLKQLGFSPREELDELLQE